MKPLVIIHEHNNAQHNVGHEPKNSQSRTQYMWHVEYSPADDGLIGSVYVFFVFSNELEYVVNFDVLWIYVSVNESQEEKMKQKNAAVRILSFYR